MIRHGLPPFLECSGKGEKRFSAFYACIQARGGFSIEAIYQGSKRFEDGSTGLSWREAKGRRAINSKWCARLYARLWVEYMEEHQELVPLLLAASGLSDIFGQVGHACQATELWAIRAACLGLPNNVNSLGSDPHPKVIHKRDMSVYPGSVYVGRPSKWGNSFVIGRDGTRKEVIQKHKIKALSDTNFVSQVREELAGRILACWCYPLPCHGDTLVHIANPPLRRSLFDF